jgi:hypothetical protein
MDAIVEFCRSRVLGPIHDGLSADEVRRLLGPPDSHKITFEYDNRQKYRYGSVVLTLFAASGQEPNGETLKVREIQLSVTPLPIRLPGPIAEQLVHPWDSARAEDVFAQLRESGLEVRLERETSIGGKSMQVYGADGGGGIVVIDGRVTEITN